MRWTIVSLSAVFAFAFAVQAVTGHAALTREGYEVSRRERRVSALRDEVARSREQVSRLASPTNLTVRARTLGLTTGYPDGVRVVRVGAESVEEDLLVRNR